MIREGLGVNAVIVCEQLTGGGMAPYRLCFVTKLAQRTVLIFFFLGGIITNSITENYKPGNFNQMRVLS